MERAENEQKASARRILGHLVERKGLFALALFLSLAATALSLSGPLILKVILDSSIPHRDTAQMLYLGLAFVAIVAAMGFANYQSSVAMAKVGLHAVTEIKRGLFARIMGLPLAWHDAHPVGELMSRVEGDTERVRDFLANIAMALVANVLFFLGMLGVFLAMDWRTTLIVLSPLPVLVAIVTVFFGKLTRMYERIRELYAELVARLAEYVQGHEVLRAFKKAGRAVRDAERRSKAKRDRDIRASLLEYTAMGLFQYITGPIFIAALVGLLAPGIFAGSFTVGALVVFIEYGRRLFEPLLAVADSLRGIQMARVALARIGAVSALPTEAELWTGTRRPGLERGVAFRGVTFSYRPGEPVLRGVDFDIPRGSTVALVGASGSGKSTTVGLLCGFYKPDAGQVLVDGVPLGELELRAWRRMTALVLQDVYLFPGSVLENVRIYDDAIGRDKVLEALEAVGALGFVERLPQGVDTVLGERGGSVSQGEKQLISFARAMAFDPELIILDEATSSVDMASERIIQASLGRMRAGRTSLIVAHRLSSIAAADEILYFKEGRIEARGRHEELLAAHADYAELVRLQLAPEGAEGETA